MWIQVGMWFQKTSLPPHAPRPTPPFQAGELWARGYMTPLSLSREIACRIQGSGPLQSIVGHASFVPLSGGGGSLLPVFAQEAPTESGGGMTAGSSPLGVRLRSGWALASRMIPSWGQGSADSRHSSGAAAGFEEAALAEGVSGGKIRGNGDAAAPSEAAAVSVREAAAAAAEARLKRNATSSSDSSAIDAVVRKGGSDMQ